MTDPTLAELRKRLERDLAAYGDRNVMVCRMDHMRLLLSALDRAEKVLEPIAARCAEAVRPDDADSAGVTVRSEHLRAAAELRAELTKEPS